jgi:hypothetical protein
VRDNLRVKEVRVGEGDAAKRFIICHNPAEPNASSRSARTRSGGWRPSSSGSSKRAKKPKIKKAADAHTKAECALRDHTSLGRYLRQTPAGRLKIDRAKIAAEARLDGKYLLLTCDPDLSAEDVALGYKNLLEAERGFRDLKGTPELRPVFHRLEHRIRAHVLICWLALTWRRISLDLGRLHLVTLTGPAGTVTQTTTISDQQAAIYNATGVPAPPRITALTPA